MKVSKVVDSEKWKEALFPIKKYLRNPNLFTFPQVEKQMHIITKFLVINGKWALQNAWDPA